MTLQAFSFPDAIDVDLPLVVSVDDTLVASNLNHEAALQFIARYPFRTYRLALWLVTGRGSLTTRLADRIDPGIETIPLRAEVLTVVRAAQASGRPVYLASAADRHYIEQLAQRIGGIAGIFDIEADTSSSGEGKEAQLVMAFGIKGYDYIGDRLVDFAAWRSARKKLVVIHSSYFAEKVRQAFPDALVVTCRRAGWREYSGALRTYQWAKNTLVFLPMIAGHRFDLATIASTLLASVCFCLAASSAYVINDLLDLPEDRNHPMKSSRPFAAGRIPIRDGIVLAAVFMAGAGLVAGLLPWRFAGVLSIYIVCTLAYSLFLKRKTLVDVIILGGLYTLRVYGGLTAAESPQSQWLLMFSLFLFLSLAIVKRCAELSANQLSVTIKSTGRAYRVEDMNVLLPLGTAAGYGAVLVVALYLSSPEVTVLYAHPERLWLVCPMLLYWISRMLILANRGEMDDDPIMFSVRDRISWLTGAGVAGVVAISI
jgi:4-hydroxybenzoate polyprenyltransferase/phosphoglycolate phosphatase-like HAD superfamily hydrolase